MDTGRCGGAPSSTEQVSAALTGPDSAALYLGYRRA